MSRETPSGLAARWLSSGVVSIFAVICTSAKISDFFPQSCECGVVLVARTLVRIFARARQKRQLRGLRLD